MNHPRIGVAILLKDNNKILLGYRKSESGKNTWGLPGGKLDFNEEPINCAIRELKEETNLDVNSNDLKFIGFSNTVFDNETHYITLIYETNKFYGELKIVEPDKCEEWKWFDNLPDNLFLPFKNFINKNEQSRLLL